MSYLRPLLPCLVALLIGCSSQSGSGSTSDAHEDAEFADGVADSSSSPTLMDATPETAERLTDTTTLSDAPTLPTVPDATAADADSGALEDAPMLPASPGCGLAAEHPPGGVQITHTFTPAAGGERSFLLSIPADYDPALPTRLFVGFSGTNWQGSQIRPYLGLESQPVPEQEIAVYPDLQWHQFAGWGELGGWLLGPHATPADGWEDIEFTRELVAHLRDRYCIDPERVFATGHSWGGDMAAVVGCFLGDVFRAVAPAAANRPYWFEPQSGEVGCVGQSAAWTFFGQADEHFHMQAYPGEFGDQQVAFWREKNGCDGDATTLPEYNGECVTYPNCSEETRYCLYAPDTGHQIPAYFTGAVLSWFRGF